MTFNSKKKKRRSYTFQNTLKTFGNTRRNDFLP